MRVRSQSVNVVRDDVPRECASATCVRGLSPEDGDVLENGAPEDHECAERERLLHLFCPPSAKDTNTLIIFRQIRQSPRRTSRPTRESFSFEVQIRPNTNLKIRNVFLPNLTFW